MAPIVKAVFETGQQQAFVDKLKQFVEKKDREIDKLAQQHFQGFVVSVGQLLNARESSAELRTKIIALNAQLQEAGADVLETEDKLAALRRMRANVDSAQLTIKTCLLVCNMADEITKHFASGQYYAALKLADQLEALNAPLCSRYEFSSLVQSSLPKMREAGREAVLRGLQDWFVSIRATSKSIGRVAMLQYSQISAQQLQRNRSESEDTRGAQADKKPAVDEEQQLENLLGNEKINVSLLPVYQCMHVYDALGQLEKFESYYTENRKLQADLVMTASFTLGSGNLKALEEFLADILGFFVVEGIVTSTTESTYLKSALVDDLWDTAATRIKNLLAKQVFDCTDVKILEDVKELLILFVSSLEHYGFQVIKLVQLLSALSSHYLAMLTAKTAKSFTKMIEEDMWEGMEVVDEEDWKRVKKFVPVGNINSVSVGSGSRYPKRLVFSTSVVECCRLTKKFIDSYYAFIDGFPAGYSEFDSMLRDAVDDLLVNYLNKAMRGILDNAKVLNLSQAVQILINIAFFDDAVLLYEQQIADARYAHKGVPLRLSARPHFRDTLFASKDVVGRAIAKKIDDFIELHDQNWMPAKITNQPSSYLLDLTVYMSILFHSTLADVPEDIRNAFYISSVEHWSNIINGQLLSPAVKHFNVQYIENLNTDVVFSITYVNDLPIPGLSDFFSPVVQTIQLMRSQSLEEYLNDKIRKQKYDLLKKESVIILLEKFRAPSSLFSSISSADKARLKSIDAVLKALRSEK